VVKPDNEERRIAMFKDNKLRLLLDLIGFSRLGANDDPDATWIIPSSLTSTELQEAIDLIRKYEFDPPTYQDGKGPEAMLRSKTAAARRKVDWDDDSDGIDRESEVDHGEYTAGGPTVRKADDANRKVLKRRRRLRTPVEPDDEEIERRVRARRKKEAEKSTELVHDSDDEDWDADKEAEFYAREEALRAQNFAAFKKSLAMGSTELAFAKKRKAEEATHENRKKRKTPLPKKVGPFDLDDSDDSEAVGNNGSGSSRAQSTEAGAILDVDSEDEATDTPLSSQHAPFPSSITPTIAKEQDVVMMDADDDDDDDSPVVRRSTTRKTRAGFVVDSDSE
jgi:replication fork protection complex subunit Tof1/Swi1